VDGAVPNRPPDWVVLLVVVGMEKGAGPEAVLWVEKKPPEGAALEVALSPANGAD
jgi:hypothetical protein